MSKIPVLPDYGRVLCQHVEPERRQDLDRVALCAALRQIYSAAESRWPGFSVQRVAFIRHLAQRLPADLPLGESLQRVRGDELYLAFACAEGCSRAIAELEAHYGTHVDAAIRNVAHPHLRTDDLGQIVRLRLFVGTDDCLPAMSGYSGTGRLSAWLRVAARRTVLNATRGFAPKLEDSSTSALLAGSSRADPEMGYLRDLYGQSFRAAFSEAVASLSEREQTLLRMSYVQQLRVRAIARMYGVHHATAARWVSAARESLVVATQQLLRRQLGVQETQQLDSIIALIRSRIAEDVAVVLREPAPGPSTP